MLLNSVVLSGACVAIPCLFLLHVVRVIYRITFHPLAGFPGPKLAGMTNLYAAYYDLILDGSLVKQLPHLHMKYGPIVRITPNELHINNAENYNKVFSVGTKFDKRWEFYSARQLQGSLIAIPDTPSAKERREAYNHYFSKAAVRRIEFLVQTKILRFLDVLRESAAKCELVDLSRGFRCLTADIIIDYAYQQDFGGLSSKGFRHPIVEAADDLAKVTQWASYFRRTFEILETISGWLPEAILCYISPEVITVNEFEQSCAESIQKLKAGHMTKNETVPTIFDTLLNPQANKNRPVPSDSALTAEAVLMLLAGMDTTANALVVGVWGILKSPRILNTLVTELDTALHEKGANVTTDDLRNLPYLGGVIKESLRLSYGAPGRLPRNVPSSGISVAGRRIPPGTVISHSNYVYHTDEAIFPQPMEFIPERWLGENSGLSDKNLLSFSQGSRVCLGINLAHTELLLTFGQLFRTFNMRVQETGKKDMEWGDYGVPVFRGHLKVLCDVRQDV